MISADMGRKAVILAVFGGLLAMFAASFIYRMNNPNLYVEVRQEQNHGGEQQSPAGSGMGSGMGGESMGQIRQFMDRVAADPEDVEALVGLGNSFLMMRAWERALVPLEKANELNPGDLIVLKGIGIAHFNNENFVAASAAYDEILEIDPNDTLALFNLGVIFKYYFEKPDQARTYFEKVLSMEKAEDDVRNMAQKELDGMK